MGAKFNPTYLDEFLFNFNAYTLQISGFDQTSENNRSIFLIVCLFPTENCKNQFLIFFTFVRGQNRIYQPPPPPDFWGNL